MRYLIWTSPNLESNIESFNKLNNLQNLNLSPILQQWATDYALIYPNHVGTQSYSLPIICDNPDSEYFNAVAICISDKLYNSITPEIVQEIVIAGGTLPNKGITEPISELPTDWFNPTTYP